METITRKYLGIDRNTGSERFGFPLNTAEFRLYCIMHEFAIWFTEDSKVATGDIETIRSYSNGGDHSTYITNPLLLSVEKDLESTVRKKENPHFREQVDVLSHSLYQELRPRYDIPFKDRRWNTIWLVVPFMSETGKSSCAEWAQIKFTESLLEAANYYFHPAGNFFLNQNIENFIDGGLGQYEWMLNKDYKIDPLILHWSFFI